MCGVGNGMGGPVNPNGGQTNPGGKGLIGRLYAKEMARKAAKKASAGTAGTTVRADPVIRDAPLATLGRTTLLGA